ncbi:WYL domain-containing protein [Psychroflexus sp. CAK1W]|uniref:helix-turn-helix transcriptional regulator n=1 Tax=Psychroflexus curvus TaxID=2873595 RepID=UPI001CCC71A9|nr:WYL domain-containing protein [Psychroflexus curvus]MBZ9628165.1 WYL domain-containing protein [Psychroflexus curvus]
MSKKESISRYNIIINTLRKRASTFKEIQEKLAFESELQDYDFNISKRTFQRDVKDISSIYNIEIEYDFSLKRYYIDFEDQPDVKGRVLEAFDIFNALNITDRLSEHIHFENRKPQGTEHLYGLLHAIKNKFLIKFNHKKFWDEHTSERIVEPYALKEFKNRWYIIARDQKDEVIKSFGLDRLTDLEITKAKFQKPADFSVTEHFRYCFGVVGPNAKSPEHIILSFTPFQGKYIKTLPLHHTQEIIIDNDEEFRISLQLYITHDFYMELRSFGYDLKVMQPEQLRKQMAWNADKVLNMYE